MIRCLFGEWNDWKKVRLKDEKPVRRLLQWSNGTSVVAQLVKNLPAIQENLVQFLGQEDPLEKG